jgi:hypothetical protein
VNVPPLVFYAELLLVVVLAALAAAWILYDPTQRPAGGLGAVHRFIERQRDIAISIGVALRTWLLLRVAVSVLGLLLGSLTSLWTIAVLGGALGWFGLPWLLRGRMTKRRLAMERAVMALVREVASLMQQSNLSLDRALREAARNPAPELRRVLGPLRSDRSVPECLTEVAALARTPMVDMLCIAVMVARTHDPAAFVRVAEQVLGPVLEVAIEIQEENNATVAQQRSAAIAIGIVMGILFFSVMRVPTMHDFYASFVGQLVVLLVIGCYLFLVWLLGQIAKPIGWTRWNVDAVRKEMEALFA